LPEDRLEKERWVVKYFGKQASTKALLIATQVVEVGLDISADLLLTEIAPVDALIQRVGRVARWGGEGQVWVYDVEDPAPYRKEIVDKTRQILAANSGAVLDWPTAKAWVNKVLNEPYRKILEEDNAYERVIAQLSRAAFEGSRAQAEATVRDINTVEVTIYDNPQSLGADVLRLPTINVHIGIAKKWAKGAKVWRVEVDRNPSDANTTVNLESITDEDISIGDRLIFPLSVLTYSLDLGLQAGGGGPNFQLRAGQTRGTPSSALQRESWIEHSFRVVQAMDQVLRDERHAVSALASLLGISKSDVEKAARLAACLHDLGKLSKQWQRRAGVSESATPQRLLAHTDGRNYGSFPPHATVSAYALWSALVDGGLLPRQLARPVCFAIAHHHSVRAREVPAFEFHPAWQQTVAQALQQCGLNGTINLNSVITYQQSRTNLREKFPPIEYERLYTAYILLSRWLRLADRIATGGRDALLHYENWFGGL
jgi:CRISPR-associated endonuclease/helicase Cas3